LLAICGAAREHLARAAEHAIWAQVGRMRQLAHDSEDIFIGEQRWNIRFGKAGDAVPALQGGVAHAVAEGRMRRALKLRTLLALAFEAVGDSANAVGTMCEILTAAAAEGFVRLLADEGPEVAPLVAKAVGALPNRGDPVVVEHAQRILDHLGWTGETAAPDQEGPLQPLEPLTRKEINVLQLLAEGYSNTALADKLFVSDSTVRTHLRNINMKLDTKSRTQAVHHGRRMGLIR
jgi:LuxR family maltose regulon positive regulatory protein